LFSGGGFFFPFLNLWVFFLDGRLGFLFARGRGTKGGGGSASNPGGGLTTFGARPSRAFFPGRGGGRFKDKLGDAENAPAPPGGGRTGNGRGWGVVDFGFTLPALLGLFFEQRWET